MSYTAKPKISHPKLPRNQLGLTARDYEGTVSTLCAGCGHDSITAALIQAVFELGLEPHILTDEVLGDMMQLIQRYQNNIQPHRIFRGVKWKG